MKRLLHLFAFTWFIINPLLAQVTKEYKLSFNPESFSIEYNDRHEGMISFDNQDFYYNEDSTLPCLPYTMVSITVPSNLEFSEVFFSEQQIDFQSDIVLAANPMVLTTSQISSLAQVQTQPVQYKKAVYPDTRVKYIASSTVGDYTIISFKVTPFEYHSQERTLELSKDITLTVSLNTTKAKPSQIKKQIDVQPLRNISINPKEISSIPNKSVITSVSEQVDYLIVTDSVLQPAFAPLVEWKQTKGVRTKVVTTEYIARTYSGNSMPLKIKQCLYDYYQNHDLQYALLGGDDSVVPVLYCYGDCFTSRGHVIREDIPTDLYYACFDGAFDWNQDHDDVFGEVEDSISLYPSIYVTRAALRSAEDVTVFTNKIIFYEKTPTMYGWNHEILVSGNKMIDYYDDQHSDTEHLVENIFKYLPWSGTKKLFFDTKTDFEGGASYDFTAQNLQDQIANGYAFIDVTTHGLETCWTMESGRVFSYVRGSRTTGRQPSIITTTACLTNAFDYSSSNPCLSESFIRNPNNGVTAYLGCSKEGWTYFDRKGPSLDYNDCFYNELLSRSDSTNFGRVVADAKIKKASISSYSGYYRWLMFGLNPIGDAEMPIYTSTPASFTNVIIRKYGNAIVVDTGIPGCTICAMSSNDMGDTYYSVIHNSQSCEFADVPDKLSICITKHNYIPYLAKWGIEHIQNETIGENQYIVSDSIKIGSNVTEDKPFGLVHFVGGNTVIESNNILIEDGTIIESNSNVTFSNPSN